MTRSCCYTTPVLATERDTDVWNSAVQYILDGPRHWLIDGTFKIVNCFSSCILPFPVALHPLVHFVGNLTGHP